MSADGGHHDLDASAVILASAARVSSNLHTTNPAVATGDGVAWPARGRALADLEFYQFQSHSPGGTWNFLISEAVRGDGAVLLDANGVASCSTFTPVPNSPPRDVVARRIASRWPHRMAGRSCSTPPG